MTAASNARARGDAMHPSQILTMIIGLVYTAVGVLGFAVTGFDDFFGRDTNETLLGFELNGLHNVVHLAIGVAGLLMWRRLDTARTYGWALAAVYGLTFLYGLAAVGNTDINILSLNGADNGLHLGSALAGLVIALWPVRDGIVSGDSDLTMERGGRRTGHQV